MPRTKKEKNKQIILNITLKNDFFLNRFSGKVCFNQKKRLWPKEKWLPHSNEKKRRRKN